MDICLEIRWHLHYLILYILCWDSWTLTYVNDRLLYSGILMGRMCVCCFTPNLKVSALPSLTHVILFQLLIVSAKNENLYEMCQDLQTSVPRLADICVVMVADIYDMIHEYMRRNCWSFVHIFMDFFSEIFGHLSRNSRTFTTWLPDLCAEFQRK